MALTLDDPPHGRLVLPPVFTLVLWDGPDSAFAAACRLASPDTTGTLVWRVDPATIDLAVVLAPDEPLATGRRAFFAGMLALAEAIGAHAPPEIPVVFDWPDTIRFDGARLGGGRLGWPEACDETAVPDWLVFSGMIIAAKRLAGDPGLTPDSTSLENEGFSLEDGHSVVIESFARHLMKAFAAWNEDGFETIARRYLARLASGPTGTTLDANGDLRGGDLHGGDLHGVGLEGGALVPALRSPSWLDPRTGGPRL